MIKRTLFVLMVFASCWTKAQDTVIVKEAFTSYFSYQLHEPLYIVYNLYKGGGDCSRKSVQFKTGNLPYSATSVDYKASGYDKGHLCNAEDKAYDCSLDAQTFFYYNCVPQTPRMNRGIWKTWETTIREESQQDSLKIICGSIFGNKKMGLDSIGVPDACWKIVISLSTGKVTHCMLFPNDLSNSYEKIDVEELKRKLNYNLIY